MKERLQRLIDLSRDAHKIMPIDENETTDARLRTKPVIETRLLDDMQSLDGWKTLTPYAAIELSDEHVLDGRTSLKFTAKSNLPDWLPGRGRGRIYSEPGAMRVIDHENWQDWNRLSLWVWPHVPGMKSLCVRVQLYNEGEHPVPDKYFREGAHNVNLKPDQWNHITVEIPHVHRDNVVGVALEYDMCGHEFDTVDTCTWYLARLELQKVEADVCEGWIPGEGVIAFSGSGYHPHEKKQAVAAESLDAKQFHVVETGTGRVVLTKPVEKRDGLCVMDFSEIIQPGRYLLKAGEISTRAFDIDEQVWDASIWKVLNFYLSQRCGVAVEGKHRACHTDLLLKHPDGRAIVANGGWHDAADLAQGMNNTADGTAALFLLARSLEGEDGMRERLHERVLKEARWGLDYVLKVRFGDGYRSSYSSLSIWTDGIIGTEDDVISIPTTSPFTNFVSAYAEALGAYALRESDPVLSRYALRIAHEDFQFAVKAQRDQTVDFFNNDTGEQDVKLYAAAVSAAAELYRAGMQEYLEVAAGYARLLMQCQQTELPDWDRPVRGFFWWDTKHTMIWHHAHHSFEQYLTMGLSTLCELCPDHPDHPHWMNALRLYCEYAKTGAAYTDPWGMLPEGVYHEDEAIDHPEMVLPTIICGDEDNLRDFKKQVQQGIALGKGYYLRKFPVWFSFRGNLNVLLSQATALGAAARITGDKEAASLVQRQLEWTVGKNPFAQSLIYGEGYEWTDEYAVQPGQTIGQMPVGIQTLDDADAPYWPQVCTATYKEVWICPANKWMWTLSQVYANGK
ncbi:MAG: glycoside hydrolase family 9 protein [Clostridia bacterium]|nr:glycoside hydrolase family 9 protein [Clostridia bacterium]